MVIAALIVGVPPWDQIQRSATPQIEDLHRDIPIGVVLPLTGALAAPYGLPMQRGFELAREEINNSGQLGDAKITFITEDDRGTVEDAVEAYNKQIHQDGVSVILGPANSSQVREAFPIAQQNRVVAISSLSSASGLSAIGDFNFRISLTTDVLVPTGIQITQEKLRYTIDRCDRNSGRTGEYRKIRHRLGRILFQRPRGRSLRLDDTYRSERQF